MKRFLKSLRKHPAVNRVLRTFTRALTRMGRSVSASPSRLCPVSGIFEIDYCGHRFRYSAEGDDTLADLLYYDHRPEETELRLFTALARRSGVILDVGANTGLYSVLGGLANPDARLFAFEPHPANHRRLLRNLKLNGLSNVTALPQALGREPGTLSLLIPADGSVSMVSSADHGFAGSFYTGAPVPVTVPCTTVDEFARAQALASVDLIKLDVEYYEAAVVEGARETLAAHAPVMLAEVFVYEYLVEQFPALAGRVDPEHSRRVERLMAEAGYLCFSIGAQGLLRVETLHAAGGCSGFLFSKKEPAAPFLPYSRMDELVTQVSGRPAMRG